MNKPGIVLFLVHLVRKKCLTTFAQVILHYLKLSDIATQHTRLR